MWGNQDSVKIGPDSKPPSYLVADLEYWMSIRTRCSVEFFQVPRYREYYVLGEIFFNKILYFCKNILLGISKWLLNKWTIAEKLTKTISDKGKVEG